jgi:hypothetical protein
MGLATRFGELSRFVDKGLFEVWHSFCTRYLPLKSHLQWWSATSHTQGLSCEASKTLPAHSLLIWLFSIAALKSRTS